MAETIKVCPDNSACDTGATALEYQQLNQSCHNRPVCSTKTAKLPLLFTAATPAAAFCHLCMAPLHSNTHHQLCISEHEQKESQSCLCTMQHCALVLLCKQPQLWEHTCKHTAWKRRTGGHLESKLLGLGLQQQLHPVNLTVLGTMRCCCMHVYVGYNHLQHSISKDSTLAIEC